MNVLDLDEAQGLTPAIVREYIAKQGYPLRKCPNYPVCKSLGRHTHQGHEKEAGVGYDFLIPDEWSPENMWRCTAAVGALDLLAALAGISAQELLRWINPRMRRGVPSSVAVQAHADGSGYWLAQSCSPEYRGVLRVGYFDNLRGFVLYERAEQGTVGFLKIPEPWHFWPCDEHGNKVRWPEKDGLML